MLKYSNPCSYLIPRNVSETVSPQSGPVTIAQQNPLSQPMHTTVTMLIGLDSSTKEK